MVLNFKDLCERRKKYKEGLAANEGFEAGTRKLLTELYPDKAHFIFELLQNAEDAGAKKVTFILKNDHLLFVHNGSKFFTLGDIESITSIANSTKEKDASSIGKFGVGFKAVFAYTNSPQIHSSNWHFQIDDLVIPKEIDGFLAKQFDKDDTVFKFPFNNPNKPMLKAYNEIELGLENLIPETILFLNNIQEIEWKIGHKIGKIHKIEKEHIVKIYKDKKEFGIYLKFRDNSMSCQTDKGKIKADVSLAYKIREGKDKKYEIIPADTKKTVFVYFPVEKEQTHLRFYINAPFATEVSRASVKNCDENNQLINALIDLQKKSFKFIKEKGMLTTDFLGILPSSKDELPEMYLPFNSEIVNFFQNEPYVPTKNGNYASANTLMQTSNKISDFITDEDIINICSVDEDVSDWSPPIWVRNPSQKHSNADNFMEDLKIRKWNDEDFQNFFSKCEYRDQANMICVSIFQKKSYEEIRKFYHLLYFFCQNSDSFYIWNFTNAPILLVNGSLFTSKTRNLYWKSSNMMPDIGFSYNLIDENIYLIGKNKADEKIIEVFKKLGISELTQESVCKNIIDEYAFYLDSKSHRYSLQKTLNIHLNDIKIILMQYKSSKNIIESLRERYWLLNSKYDESKNVQFSKPDELYLKTIDGNKNGNLILDKNILSLSSVYKKHLKPREWTDFLSLLKDVGIHENIWIKRISVEKNPQYYEKLLSYYNYTSNGINIDYTIPEIDCLLDKNNLTIEVSKLIWDLVIVEENTLNARYKANQKDNYRSCESTYVYKLKTTPWIYNKDGIICLPTDVDLLSLNKIYKFDSNVNNLLLEKIDFGENSRKKQEEKEEKDSIAQKFGFENSNALEESKLAYEYVKKHGIDFHETGKTSFPERRVIDIQSKIRDAKYNFDKSKNKEYKYIEASKRTSNLDAKSDAHDYLLNMYTNNDSEMICQLCHNKMPFKTRNREYYFEAVEISNTITKENRMNYLALCPNCAAEYKEWVKNDCKKQDELIEAIKSKEPNDSDGIISIEFKLHKNDKELKFTGKHYLDIHTVLISNHKEEE